MDKYMEGNECNGVTWEDGEDYGFENENKYRDENEFGAKYNIQSEQDNRYVDGDGSDDHIVFQEESEGNVSGKTERKERNYKEKRTVTGPYFICLRLQTALEKLGFDDTGCFDQCGSE